MKLKAFHRSLQSGASGLNRSTISSVVLTALMAGILSKGAIFGSARPNGLVHLLVCLFFANVATDGGGSVEACEGEAPFPMSNMYTV